MQKAVLSLVLFLLFLLEGTILKWIIPVVWQEQVVVSTHFTLVVILFIGIYRNRHSAMFYGLVFGLLHDIVYYGATMVGTFSFAMGVTGYLSGLVNLRSRGNLLSSMVVLTMGNFIYEGIIYALYRSFQITQESLNWIFFRHMLPSVLINLLFALLVYVPLRKWLEDMSQNRTEED